MNAREQMLKDLEEQNKLAEKTNSAYGGTFKKTLLVDGPKYWSCREGEHIIDIIPYKVSKDHPNPHVKTGSYAYFLDVFVHNNIGKMKEQCICLKETYNEPCPVCEYKMEYMSQDNFDDKIAKGLNAKKKTLYNIVCYDDEKQQAKGVQAWMVAWYYMQKHLVPLAKNKRTGQNIPFTHPDLGKSIQFNRKGMDINGEFFGHSLLDRIDSEDKAYTISDEILDSAYTLENLIKKPSYDEIYALVYGTDFVNRDEAISSEPEEVNKEMNESEEVNECPHGHKFGIDLNGKPECDECEVWDDCRVRNNKFKS